MKIGQSKIKIIFDFDNTLFSTRKFYRFSESSFAKFGVKRKIFRETFQRSIKKRGAYDPEKGVYNQKRHFELIEKATKEFSVETLDREMKKVFKKCPNFLYPDVKNFLERWSKKATLILLSFGDKDFQKNKIRNSSVLKFFKEFTVAKSRLKTEEIENFYSKNEKIFFTEDNPKSLYSAKKQSKDIITVRINRGEGRYKDLPNNRNIDFSIRSLRELDQILEKLLNKPRALLLFSGGLDSILVAKILVDQGIETKGIVFKSYFFDEKKAVEIAKRIKLPLKVVDISKSHLKIVKNPKYGYGKSMNPCLDCRILMLKKAKEIMKREKFDFVATGEVLGERPITQNRKALLFTEKESNLRGCLLRPLSARLLPKTIPEKLGLIKREKLLDINGRSRKKQMALAQKFKIKKYPSPAGGCLLTDLEFGKRLRGLLKIYPEVEGGDIKLLKLGRHFWEKNIKIVVGRNEEENKKIKKLSRKGDILIEMKNYPGPVTLIRSYDKRNIPKEIMEKGKKLTRYYSLKSRGKKDVTFKILTKR